MPEKKKELRLISPLETRERRAYRNEFIKTLPEPQFAMPENKELHNNPQEVEKARRAQGEKNAEAIIKHMAGFKPSKEAVEATANMPKIEPVTNK